MPIIFVNVPTSGLRNVILTFTNRGKQNAEIIKHATGCFSIKSI